MTTVALDLSVQFLALVAHHHSAFALDGRSPMTVLKVRRPSCRFCSSIELGHPQNQLRTPELNHGQLPFFRGTVQRNRKGGECLSCRWLAAELAERPRPTPSTPEAGAGSPPKDSLEVRSPAPASSTARKSEGECRSRLFVRGDRNFAAVGFDD